MVLQLGSSVFVQLTFYKSDYLFLHDGFAEVETIAALQVCQPNMGIRPVRTLCFSTHVANGQRNTYFLVICQGKKCIFPCNLSTLMLT